jgi:hypothetical protein
VKKIAIVLAVSVIVVLLAASCASTGSSAATEPAAAPAAAPAPAPAPAGPKIVLDATKAKLTSGGGEGIRMEAGGNVGYWSSLDDIITWTFDVAEAGDYDVILNYSAASSFAGALAKVTVADQVLEWKASSTDDWTSYTDLNVGTVKLAAGPQTLSLQGTKIRVRFVANIMFVALVKK